MNDNAIAARISATYGRRLVQVFGGIPLDLFTEVEIMREEQGLKMAEVVRRALRADVDAYNARVKA